MNPNFEKPKQTSTKEHSEDQINAGEAMAKAEQTIKEILSSLKEEADQRLAENPSVHLKGRGWQLEDLPEEYKKIGFLQKRLSVIEDELDETLLENEESEPGSSAEALSYFRAQLLARTKKVEEQKIELAAEELGLRLQHPDIHEALNKQETPQDTRKAA